MLLAQGFEKKSSGISLTPRQTKVYLKKFHHCVYLHPERRTCVELHWKIHQIDLKLTPFSQGKALSGVEIGGCVVPVLPNEEWLFYLMVHGSIHKWCRLRWLIDVERFLKCADINWDKLMRLAEGSGMNLIVYQTMLLLHRFFHQDFPDNLFQDALQDKKAVRLADEITYYLSRQFGKKATDTVPSYWRNFIDTHGYRFRMQNGWKNKCSYIHSLIQPIERDFQICALPDPLYPLYYFIRPMTWFMRRISCAKEKKQ